MTVRSAVTRKKPHSRATSHALSRATIILSLANRVKKTRDAKRATRRREASEADKKLIQDRFGQAALYDYIGLLELKKSIEQKKRKSSKDKKALTDIDRQIADLLGKVRTNVVVGDRLNIIRENSRSRSVSRKKSSLRGLRSAERSSDRFAQSAANNAVIAQKKADEDARIAKEKALKEKREALKEQKAAEKAKKLAKRLVNMDVNTTRRQSARIAAAAAIKPKLH